MKNSRISSIALWSFTVLFFAYQFILRLSPGVFLEDIMLRFQIDATNFGLLAGCYYLGYAGMQIPIGMLLDKYGVRYIVSSCAIICSIGNLAMVYANTWELALIGRFLVGFGSAAGALGAIKAVRMNFDHEHVSKMIGWSITVGLLGAINGKTINLKFSHAFGGWENAILYLSLLGGIIGFLILVFVRDKKEHIGFKSQFSVISSLIEVAQNPKVILLAISGALLVGPLEAFADIWGEPFFMHVYGFSKVEAGDLSSMSLYFGMCVGSPLLAYIVDKYQSHYLVNILCGLIMAIIYYILLKHWVSNYYLIYIMMFSVGIMCAYQVIVFSTATCMVSAEISGIVIAFVNAINMLAGSCFQSGIGYLLDIFWNGQINNGIRIYNAQSYTDTLYILPLTLIIGTIGFMILKPRRGIC